MTGDTNGREDVFVRDRELGTTTRVNLSTTSAQANGWLGDFVADLSANGRWVVFSCEASNLVDGDTNGLCDVFVRDLVAATTTRISVTATGQQSTGITSDARISGDGRRVVYTSIAADLVPTDTDGLPDIFVHDRDTGSVRRLNLGPAGVEAYAASEDPDLSFDGSSVVFASEASNLTSGEGPFDLDFDIFAIGVDGAGLRRVSIGVDEPNGRSERPLIGADGSVVAFDSEASNLVPADANGVRDVFTRGGLGDVVFGGPGGSFEGP